jgi:signal transduction histidine kinase
MRGVVVEVTARKQAEAALQDYSRRLETLSRQLLEVQEQERRHLARELHDEIGQVLTLIKMKVNAAARQAEGSARAGLDDALGVVESAIQQVRNLSLDLRPSMLDDFGLEAALEWYVNRQAADTTFTVQLDSNLGEDRLPAEIETACFRVVQEALTNAARHAKARHVAVTICRTGKDLQLSVRDDGIGFDVGAARQRASRGRSVGLLGMQERVELLGGQIHIQSAPGRGTEIQVHFAIPAAASAGR